MRCLTSEVSPYRYYAFRPEQAGSPGAKRAYRKLVQVHPNCFRSFCENVCTEAPENYRPAIDLSPEQSAHGSDRYRSRSRSRARSHSASDGSFDDSFSEGSFSDTGDEFSGEEEAFESPTSASKSRRKRLSRTLSRGFKTVQKGYRQTRRWATKKYNKRQENLRERRLQKAEHSRRICQSGTTQGRQLRALCSECVSYLPPSYRIIPACIERKGASQRQGSSYSAGSGRSPSSRTGSSAWFNPEQSAGLPRAPRSRTYRQPPRGFSGSQAPYSQFREPSERSSYRRAFRGPETSPSFERRAGSSESSDSGRPASLGTPSRRTEGSAQSESDGFADTDPFWDA